MRSLGFEPGIGADLIIKEITANDLISLFNHLVDHIANVESINDVIVLNIILVVLLGLISLFA